MTYGTLRFQEAVVNSFQGACARVLRGMLDTGKPDPRPILWLFLDHVLLLAQSPVYFTISLIEDATGQVVRRFSSLSQQDRAFWNLPALSLETLHADQIVAERSFRGRTVHVALCPTPNAHKAPRDVVDILREGTESLLEAADIRLCRALESLESDHPDMSTTAPTRVVANDVWNRQLELIRTRLDPILTSYGTCELFPRDAAGRTRLFIVPRQPFSDRFWSGGTAVRTVLRSGQSMPAKYGYTAGLFLTPSQRNERQLTAHQLELLTPLADGTRAIADTPLTSGIIDIGFPGERDPSISHSREYSPSTKTNVAIKELEDQIYGPDWRSESIFYVPVHIGGVPWLALFSFHREGAADTTGTAADLMWRRYFIYRDIVPTIAEEVSQAVAQAFADALAEAARDHLATIGDAELFAEKATAAWKDLSVIFPYGTARLSAVPLEGNEPRLQLRLSGRTQSFYLSVCREESNVSYRLLDLELTRGLLELRLQAALEARVQERNTLIGLTVHEWVNKLADGIARSEKLKEAAIAAELDDSIMDHVYGLYGTLHGDIGLPWILDEKEFPSRTRARHFTSRKATESDVVFLRALFEFHARAMLSARDCLGPIVRFEFTCSQFPRVNVSLDLSPRDAGLARVGRELEELLVAHPSPWPLDTAAGKSPTTREGMLSALTLAPREMLRNAIRHGSSASPTDVVIFSVEVSPDQSMVAASVDNPVPAGADVEKRLTDMRSRCAQLQNAVPFARCSPSHDATSGRFVVRCVMTIERGDHE